ncbi:MAG: hypothetical protein JW840_10125 [Candidatus Thermoplasmatota archaeon]|nr:hypothetical protein [Candidatus Thermoplasmatota archaeon]
MKKRIIGLGICTLLLFPLISLPSAADPAPDLMIKLVGGLPFPLLFHYVGGVISNKGDTAAYNISYTLTLRGGILGTTNETVNGNTEEILPQTAYAVGIFNAYGFGRVTLTLMVTASNAANVTDAVQGLQLGGFTWIPFSWMKR